MNNDEIFKLIQGLTSKQLDKAAELSLYYYSRNMADGLIRPLLYDTVISNRNKEELIRTIVAISKTPDNPALQKIQEKYPTTNKLITASEARKILRKENPIKYSDFNNLVLKAITKKESTVFLDILSAGFIARLRREGYSVCKLYGSYQISWEIKNKQKTPSML